MDVTQAPPDRRRSRWDEHRLVGRAELVEATLLAIRTHGAGVGMDEVAATARTSKTVFYRHFTDRAGLYTAVAERVDATIIRGVLLPVSMKLLGEKNWWLPRRLGWLPSIRHESEAAPAKA